MTKSKQVYPTNPRDRKDSSNLEWEERDLYPALFTWDEPKVRDWGE